MAKQYLKINDFSGGAVDAYDPRDLKPNQFVKVENLMLDKRSSLTTFGGEKEHQDVPSGDAIVICPGYGLFIYDADHTKGNSYADASDEGENWMAVTDATNGKVDLFDLANGSVVANKITLGTPKTYSPGTHGSPAEPRIQVVETTATPPSSASAPYKSDTIFLDSSGGLANNFKFPDGSGSDWYFKVGDIVNISGHVTNSQNNVNAVRIKSLTPSTTNAEGSYITASQNRNFDSAGVGDWVLYEDTDAIAHSSNTLEIQSPSSGTSGAKLATDKITSDSNLDVSFVVSARLRTDSGDRDDMFFKLGNATSSSFSIDGTFKYHSAVLKPTNYDADNTAGLVIYSTTNSATDWYIDDINITRDGVFMQFDQRVLYRTDEEGLTGGEYGGFTTLAETGGVVLTLLPKTVFHFADEALRVSDATLSTGSTSTPPKNQWWGYIKRTQFDDADASHCKREISGWFSSDNDLPAPTEFDVVNGTSGSTATLTYPANGTGFDIAVDDYATAHNDNYGTWLTGDYDCALSFVYDGNQESLLKAGSAAFSVEADSSFLTISIGAASDIDDADRYTERISGGRVYARREGTDDDWQLLCEIDIKNGARAKPFGDFTAWANGGGSDQAKVESIYSLDPNIDTYETLNGFSQNEKKLTISGTNEGYKTSVIANRRCFVANVKTKNEDEETIQMRDRIMYSPINRFDTFPRSFFIDTVKGDAEEYIKVEEYADRLLAFKQRRLHIINIQDPSPANWFLEDIKDYAGIAHHSASTKTELGVVWASKEGCFHYDGRSVNNLILGKIAESTWENFITTESSVFYNPQKYYVCVLADYFGGDNSIYLYDFRTKSWIKGSSTFINNDNRTNFVIDWNGNPAVIFQPLVENEKWELMGDNWGSYTSLVGHVWERLASKKLIPREWSDDLVRHPSDTVVLQTKDYDFGEPGLIKKVYSVTITYASDVDMENHIYYDTNGGTTFNDYFTGAFSGTGSGWKQVRATLSSPVECQSFALKISNSIETGTTEGLKINDISLEYRVLRKRVS